jgi:hypothetical protein
MMVIRQVGNRSDNKKGELAFAFRQAADGKSASRRDKPTF